jgi:D-methionine transport system permease protein
MPEHLIDRLPDLAAALGHTLALLGIGLSAAVVFGGPLGILLFLVGDGQSLRNRPLALVLGWTVNTIRSFPFIILLVALAPLPVAAVPFFARLVEQTLRDVSSGEIEAAQAMGASALQIVTRVLLVEARSGLVLALTVLALSVLAYSALAGVGGVGTDIMACTVCALVALMQVIHLAGTRCARRLDRR